MTISTPACLLLGEPGSGKTFSLATLAKRKKLIYIYTDPGGDESLLNGMEMYDVPIDNLHWHYCPPAASDWSALEDLAKKMNSFSYATLSKLDGVSKASHKQLNEVIELLGDFTCQRTGENLGDLSQLGPEYAFAFDSISGLNQMAKETAVGAKPTLHEGEWLLAQTIEEVFIRTCVSNLRCTKVFIGHTEQQRDDLLGRMVFTASFVGKKLASKGTIARLFSDIIFTYRDNGKFYWSTDDDRIALKTRNLPIKNDLKPDFGQVIDSYERRLKQTNVEIPSAN